MSDGEGHCDLRRLPRQQQAILHAMACDLTDDARAWGEPPEVLLAFEKSGRVTMRPLGLPDALWAGHEPALVLTVLADGSEAAIARYSHLVPGGLVGVGLRCEAWVLHDVDGTELDTMTDGRVRNHPEAVSCRFAYCVDRAGTTYGMETDSEGRLAGRAHVVPAGDRHSAVTGAVPEALDRILQAALGVPLHHRTNPLAGNTPRKDTPA